MYPERHGGAGAGCSAIPVFANWSWDMPDYEEMPLPQRGDEDFPLWLVPARNNIQRQLLRVQRMLGQPSKDRRLIPLTQVALHVVF